jgi:hypothetical protein
MQSQSAAAQTATVAKPLLDTPSGTPALGFDLTAGALARMGAGPAAGAQEVAKLAQTHHLRIWYHHVTRHE